MSRIKFKKGRQRGFLMEVLRKMDCPSLRALNQFGFEIPYSTLKNYFGESRTLPEKFFNDLCYLSKLNKNNLNFEIIHENWGKIKGGKKSRRKVSPNKK
ncbi:hypothetical protein J4411_03590 [Candidatus Pacearchaeota archaeon]|nr:hypothetical protein [Candidatus Pacearchaeota archaeon]